MKQLSPRMFNILKHLAGDGLADERLNMHPYKALVRRGLASFVYNEGFSITASGQATYNELKTMSTYILNIMEAATVADAKKAYGQLIVYRMRLHKRVTQPHVHTSMVELNALKEVDNDLIPKAQKHLAEKFPDDIEKFYGVVDLSLYITHTISLT